MIKRIIKLALIGFVVGIAFGNIIAMISSYMTEGHVLVFAPSLEAKAGSAAMALTIQTLFCGILGAICFAGVILYESERLGLLITAVLHFLICLAPFYPIAFTLGWIRPVASDIITWFFIEAAAYFVVWLIMYIKYRIEVRELNKLLASEPAPASSAN